MTNDVSNWETGACRYGALLTPQGKVLTDFLAVRTADGVALDCDRATAHDFAKRLKLFRLRSDVDIEIDEQIEVAAAITPKPDTQVPTSAILNYADPRYSGTRQRIWVKQLSTGTDLSPYHEDRIAHGLPELGVDFEPASVFPADINMDQLGGVDLKKGCFVGQEVVSRMHRRAKIRRRTIVLQGENLQPGATIGNNGAVGHVTSESNGTALALVRTDRLSKLIKANTLTLENGISIKCILPNWLQQELDSVEAD